MLCGVGSDGGEGVVMLRLHRLHLPMTRLAKGSFENWTSDDALVFEEILCISGLCRKLKLSTCASLLLHAAKHLVSPICLRSVT